MAAAPIRCTITPLGASNSGLVELHGWSGWVPELQHVGDTYRRLGESGRGMQSTGKEARLTDCTGWRGEATSATAETYVAKIDALQWQICTIKDPYSRTLKRVRFHLAIAIPTACKGPQINGASQAGMVIACRFQVERLPDS